MPDQTRIAEYIKEKGLKKKFVAEKAGIKTDRFSRIIHNDYELKADELERICRVLNVSPEKFLDWQAEN